MAKVNKKNEVSGEKEFKSKRRRLRRDLIGLIAEMSQKSQDTRKAFGRQEDAYSRQTEYDDVFSEWYASKEGQVKVLKPAYSPEKMYQLGEECAPLSACVEAFVRNIDGYGQEACASVGVNADLDAGGLAEKAILEEIINNPNGAEPFSRIRANFRRDYEYTGNAYLEVTNDLMGRPSLIFWADAKRTRLCPLDENTTDIELSVVRGGKEIKVPAKKRFRRYAMVTVSGDKRTAEVRYFKEFGDKRHMNAINGEYVEDSKWKKESNSKKYIEATSIIHYKFGSGTYGVPRWISNLCEVLGLSRASFVNFDLFDNQGIPQMIIAIMNGQLTEDSLQDLKDLFTKAKGVENFNRWLLLETESTIEGMTAQGMVKESPSKIDVKSMTEFRKEDAMFSSYIALAAMGIRTYGFRLPNTFIGQTEDINYATAEISRFIVEDQVFGPERHGFDEFFNMTITSALGLKKVKFRTLAPRLVSPDVLVKVLPTLAEKGALTLNELIDISNKFLGTDYEPYDEEWANCPIPFIIELKKDLFKLMFPNLELASDVMAEKRLEEKARERGNSQVPGTEEKPSLSVVKME